MDWKDDSKMDWMEEIRSICNASCERMEHGCREQCPCGYCRIRVLIYENNKK